ncbi:Transmembrane protein [Trema orientale]|uniref:Transmembrane protein n=1 Tax=Trema orientale TaxID=63057 RepID=A0A2P5B998_TREOI|nr:Transmembrane protein [Trema orientale]
MVEWWTVSEENQERKQLLREKKKVLSLVENNDGNSLLHVACKSSDSSLVEKLVRLGADISACNYEKLYPHQCGSNAIITDLIHQSLLAVTNRQPSYIVSFALKGSLVFRPSLKFNKGLSNTDIALFVVVIAMVISVCALTMATPPGGVLVADYELSKGFYVNGTSTHEDNNGRNIPGKSVLSWTYLTLVWLCNSACFFMSLMFNAILMPTQRKSGFWAALTISFFAGAQYLSWVCAVSYHWLYVAATASELSVVLIFIVGFGYYQDHDAKICEITSSFQNFHGLQMAFNDNRGANFQPVTVNDELEVIRRI